MYSVLMSTLAHDLDLLAAALQARAHRDNIQTRADRAFHRSITGQGTTAYAMRMANLLERAEGDYWRALYAANIQLDETE